VELTQLAVAITSKQLGSAAHPVARLYSDAKVANRYVWHGGDRENGP
jgi:hypothetical protein